MNLHPLDEHSVRVIEQWFDDAETQQYLGDRGWIRRELDLTMSMPGQRFRGRTVTARLAWVAYEEDEPVAFVGVEVYDDRTASGAVVVTPSHRGRGVARAALATVAREPELRQVSVVFGGVDPGNVAIQKALAAIGASIATTPDAHDMLPVTISMPGHTPAGADGDRP